MKEYDKDVLLKGFIEALHRAIIVIDDFFCDTFGLSRKAKGKYIAGRKG